VERSLVEDVPAGAAGGDVDLSLDDDVQAGGIVLRLGSSRYTVAMSEVAEVIALPPITRIPGSPPFLRGVANWRGRMLPVLDLRPLLGCPTVPLASSARLVVVQAGPVTAGVVAEAVPGVYDASLTDVAGPPATISAETARIVSGQVSDALGPIAVLDVPSLLALRERVDRRRHGG
jgi:purine-binding chemotaxis protein CheW